MVYSGEKGLASLLRCLEFPLQPRSNSVNLVASFRHIRKPSSCHNLILPRLSWSAQNPHLPIIPLSLISCLKTAVAPHCYSSSLYLSLFRLLYGSRKIIAKLKSDFVMFQLQTLQCLPFNTSQILD